MEDLLLFQVEKLTYSIEIKHLLTLCREGVKKYFACTRNERPISLRNIIKLLKSLDDIIRKKPLLQEYNGYKKKMDEILESYSEESQVSQVFMKMHYILGKDITRFYGYTDHITWTFMYKLKSPTLLIRNTIAMRDRDVIHAFLRHVELTYYSMTTLEYKIEQFAQIIEETK